MKTYTLHISIPGTGRVWRKIEIGAAQTLEQLHDAIQDAFEFDNDHLYSFFMSGKAWDRKTEYCLPDGYDPLSFFDQPEDPLAEELDEETFDIEFDPENPETFLQFMFGDDQASIEKARQALESPLFQQIRDHLDEVYAEPGDVRTTPLDSLGLTIGKNFLYLFDYGDEWQFTVRVHDINFNAPEADYPRIVQSVGDPPPQYPVFEDDYEADDFIPFRGFKDNIDSNDEDDDPAASNEQ